MALFSRKPANFANVRSGEGDAKKFSRLHALCFERPWGSSEFAMLLARPSSLGLLSRPVGKPDGEPVGFVLLRCAADEAEILSIGVAPKHRQSGLGRSLMDEAIRILQGDRMQNLFLEVAQDNVAAIALYQRLGFKTVSERPGYYGSGNVKMAALVMRLDLK